MTKTTYVVKCSSNKLSGAARRSSPVERGPLRGATAPTADEQAGIDWWNGQSEADRAVWLRAANTYIPAEAWAYFKASSRRT